MVLNNMYIECTNSIGFLYIDIIKQNVQEFERIFQLQASPTYETQQNISEKFLKIAAEQFIYLNHCPDTKTSYFMSKISMSTKPKVSNLFIQGAIRVIIWSSSFFTQNSPCPHNLSFLAPHCMIFRRILYHHLGESKTKMNIFLDNWRKNFNSNSEKFGVYTMVQLLLQNILI